MKRFIVIFLAGIGSLALLLVLLAFLFSTLVSSPESNDINLKGEFESPNSEFRAAHFVGMGGGAAGWCNEVVTVQPRLPAGTKSDDLMRDFKVFSVSCGSDVQVRWVGMQNLSLAFLSKIAPAVHPLICGLKTAPGKFMSATALTPNRSLQRTASPPAELAR
ncbi:hypothetical protein [Pelomonas sp. Root1444]|uniref:hypothetical protein n=1 Tax=Pelomonas sp. Root1444 TaxID=1736464 RepID=UPI00138F5011|nr:hypothetical protein [Pelomonas sp. Root1444]